MQRRTYSAKPSEVVRKWHLVDAEGVPLGRLASRVARILQGKHKPTYTTHIDTGDFVVVINAKKVGLTGRKKDQKVYVRYTGWVGGQRETKVADMLERKPTEVVRLAVRRMMPKSTLGRHMLSKLKISAGPEHRHGAQQPVELDITKFQG
jgi:large subunit ribosomal protein L13